VLALLLSASGVPLHAQTIATPTSATTASTSAVTNTTTAGASRGGALLSAMKAADLRFKTAFYNSPLGKLLVNMRKPLSALTGGMVQSESPLANALAGGGAPPPSPAMAAAATIKADAQQAAQRREAVRYLGTVDCHYYPEAEQAIISALRCDRSECVRLEAALALSRGCCCTKKTMEALKIAVSGSARDGNPGETSLRVRMTSLEALQNCLANCNPLDSATPPPTVRPEYPDPPLAPQSELPPSAPPTTAPPTTSPQPELPISAGDVGRQVPATYRYYAALDAKPLARVIAEAEQTVSHITVAPQPELGGYGTGRRSLVSLWEQSAAPPSTTPNVQAPQPALAAGPNSQLPPDVAARVDAYPVSPYGAAPFGAPAYNAIPHDAAAFDPATVPFPAGDHHFPTQLPPPPAASLRRTPPVFEAELPQTDLPRR
jgi:hypothetical protein